MGGFGVICVDDIVEEIWNKGPHLSKVLACMWPFQLASNEEVIKGAIKHDATGVEVKKNQMKVSKGGNLGNLEDKINDFVRALI